MEKLEFMSLYKIELSGIPCNLSCSVIDILMYMYAEQLQVIFEAVNFKFNKEKLHFFDTCSEKTPVADYSYRY